MKISKTVAAVQALMLLGVSGLSHADYLYQYTGNTFTQADATTTGSYPPDYDPGTPASSLAGQNFSISLTSNVLLSARTYSMAELFAMHAQFKVGDTLFPVYDPSQYYPSYQKSTVDFSLLNVDAAGVPTAWSISASDDSQYSQLFYSHTVSSSSTSGDKTTLINPGDYQYGETLINWASTPLAGKWSLTNVSAVPESNTMLMLLAGLGLVMLTRKRMV